MSSLRVSLGVAKLCKIRIRNCLFENKAIALVGLIKDLQENKRKKHLINTNNTQSTH